MGWTLFRRDPAAVLDALRAGERPTAVMTGGLTELDEFVYMAYSLGVFEALELLKVGRKREGIPDDVLLRTVAVLPFIQAFSLDGAAKALFRDPAILLQLGYTALNLREGFNERYNNAKGVKSALPVHPDVLRDELARLDQESLGQFEDRCVGEIFKRGLVRGNIYAVDATGLHDDWKVVVLCNVTRSRAFVVSWRLLPGKASEKGVAAAVTQGLVDEAIRRGACGDRAGIKLLVMDAAYADGPLLAQLKWGIGPDQRARGIDALVRLPEDKQAYADMQELSRLHSGIELKDPEVQWETHREVRCISGHKQDRKVECAAFPSLASWDGFEREARRLGAPTKEMELWGALVREVEPKAQPVEEAMGLISTRSFPSAWAGYNTYRDRWEIENSVFREMKEGWHLEKAPWGRTEETVRGRVCFTCVAFNTAKAYQTKSGQRVIELGIRRLGLEMRRSFGLAPVVVYLGDAYGVFELEQLLEIFGHPVAESVLPAPHKRRGKLSPPLKGDGRGPPARSG